jgi:hypothetical protein
MTRRAHAARPAAGGIAIAAMALAGACGILAVAPALAIELDQVTVVTLARDGSWGVATASSTGEAIAAAVGACRAMAEDRSDCGARLATTRGRWVIASLCGDHPIIVTADTREDAEAATVRREREVRRVYVPDLPRCRRMLVVDAAGGIAVAAPRHFGRAKAERQFRYRLK